MQPNHHPIWEDGSEAPFFGDTVSCSAGNPAIAPAPSAPCAFRWIEEDTGDDLADEILAWATAEEPVDSPVTDSDSDDLVPLHLI